MRYAPPRPLHRGIERRRDRVDQQAVLAPIDIELPQHPEASRAELHRDPDGWAITFSGQEPFAGQEFVIAADTLVGAGVDPSLERLVTGYVETRLLAAGYGIAPWDETPPAATGGWTLRR
jgi:hypothetical protein